MSIKVPNKPVLDAVKITVATVMAVILLGGVAHISEQARQDAKQNYLLQQLARVAPIPINNEDADDEVVMERQPGRNGDSIYQLYQNDNLAGYIIETTAPDGYNGAIRLLIGVDLSGRVHAVYPLEHKETPGLGDRINPQHTDWINALQGMSADSLDAAWRTKRQGGDFPILSGASITANAVLRQVRKALQQANSMRAVRGTTQ